jgi:hypothetical protein
MLGRAHLVAPCLFLLLAGCIGLPPREASSHKYYNELKIAETHFLRGGRVPLLPALKWLDTASIMQGARPIAEIGGFHRVASITVPVSEGGSIEWHIALAARTEVPSNAVEGLLARLERASRLAAQFDLVKKPGISIELRLLEDGQSIDVVHRDYYFSRPELIFYLKAGSSEDFAWVWGELPTVLHELVHYRGSYVDMSYIDDQFSLVREEIAASVAEYCGMFLGGLAEADVSAIRHSANRNEPQSDAIPLDIYRKYGPTAVGKIVASRWVLYDYVENREAAAATIVVRKSQEAEFSRRCSEAFKAAKFALVSETAAGLRVKWGKD